MKDIAQHFPENPLHIPKDLQPEVQGLQIISLINPGVFCYKGKIWLLIKVAEGTVSKPGLIYFPILNATGNVEVLKVPLNDPILSQQMHV